MKLATCCTMFLAAAVLCCSVSAQETEIKRKDVPPVVLAAFDKAYSSVKVLEWEKEIHGGKLYSRRKPSMTRYRGTFSITLTGPSRRLLKRLRRRSFPPQ